MIQTYFYVGSFKIRDKKLVLFLIIEKLRKNNLFMADWSREFMDYYSRLSDLMGRDLEHFVEILIGGI
jgi:hypothetical protein